MIVRCTVLDAFIEESPEAARETLVVREAFSVSAYYLPEGDGLDFEPSPEADRLHVVLEGRCALVMRQTRLNVERGNALGIGGPGAHRLEALDGGVAFLTLAMRRRIEHQAPSGDLTIMTLLGGARAGARERLAEWASRPSVNGRLSLLTPDLYPTGPRQIFASSERLFIVLEGVLKIEADGITHSAEGPSIVMVPPDTPHRVFGEEGDPLTVLSISDPEPASDLISHMACGHRARWCDLIRLQEDGYIKISANGTIEELNKQAITLLRLPGPGRRDDLSSHLSPEDAQWLRTRLREPHPGEPARTTWMIPGQEKASALQVLFIPFQGDLALQSALLVLRPVARSTDIVFDTHESQERKAGGESLSAASSSKPRREGIIPESGSSMDKPVRLVMASRVMLDLVRRVENLSQEREWLVLWGEPGSGRMTLARYAHELNPGQRNAFRVLDCASMPPSKLMNLLFDPSDEGEDPAPGPWLESQGDATIVLDGLDAYSADKRRRVFMKLTHLRRKGESPARFMARVRHKPHRGLPSAATRRSRGSGISVLEVPSLSRRPEDVLLLFRLFMEEYGGESRIPALASDALEELLNGPIPDNILGLRRLTQALTATRIDGCIQASTLRTLLARPHPPEWLGDATSIPTFAEAERGLVIQALKVHGGNKTKAARALQITRARLYRMMADHGVKG